MGNISSWLCAPSRDKVPNTSPPIKRATKLAFLIPEGPPEIVVCLEQRMYSVSGINVAIRAEDANGREGGELCFGVFVRVC